MNNKDLDNLFRNKIQDAEQNANMPSDWDTFSKILSQSEGFSKVDFDKKIQDKLSVHKERFNSNHWELLRQRLLKEENIKKYLYNFKLGEVAAIFLVILFIQLYDINKNQDQEVKEYAQNSSDKNKPNKEGKKVISIKDVDAYAFSPHAYETNSEYELSKEEYNNKSGSSRQYVDSGNKIYDPVTTPKDIVKTINLVDEVPTLKVASIGTSFVTLKNDNTINENSNEDKLDTKASKAIQKQQTTIDQPQALPTLAISEVESMRDLPIAIDPNINLIDDYTIKPRHFLQPTIQLGYNFVNSSYDEVYRQSATTIADKQIGFGLLYSFVKNNVELQSGIRYTRRYYNPTSIVETYETPNLDKYDLSLNEIRFDIIDIPLNIKFFYAKKNKYSFYSKIGAHANLNIKNTYSIFDYRSTTNSEVGFKQASDLSGVQAGIYNVVSSINSEESVTSGARISDRSLLSQKEFPKGILDKGSLSDNTFLTVSGELGVERKIGDKSSLVLGLEFNKFFRIEGIGPNKDKLNTLALNVGMKYAIN